MDYDDLMPRGQSRAEQELEKQQRQRDYEAEAKRIEDAKPKPMTVQEFIVKLLELPDQQAPVLIKDPGCGCCSTEEYGAADIYNFEGKVTIWEAE